MFVIMQIYNCYYLVVCHPIHKDSISGTFSGTILLSDPKNPYEQLGPGKSTGVNGTTVLLRGPDLKLAIANFEAYLAIRDEEEKSAKYTLELIDRKDKNHRTVYAVYKHFEGKTESSPNFSILLDLIITHELSLFEVCSITNANQASMLMETKFKGYKSGTPLSASEKAQICDYKVPESLKF